jgi:hypothetical protein
MDRRDRDELDAHIMGDHELDEDETTTREIAREIRGWAHPEDQPDLLRETWIQGSFKSDDDSEILLRLDHGVGQGHAHLSLMVEIDGERIAWEYVDMTTLVEFWAQAIVADHMIKLAARELDAETQLSEQIDAELDERADDV